MKLWFLISELRAAALPAMSDEYFDALMNDVSLGLDKKRFREGSEPAEYEFHFSNFMYSERLALTRFHWPAEAQHGNVRGGR